MRSGRPAVRMGVVGVLLTVTGTACSSSRDVSAPQAGSCPVIKQGRSTEQVGGPLKVLGSGTTFGLTMPNPGQFRDATVIPLVNRAAGPIRLLSVDLVPEPGAGSVALKEAFVVPADAVQGVRPARSGAAITRAANYCLAPGEDEMSPVLGLRIAPAGNGTRGIWPNNTVNVHYVSGATRYVVAFPVRFEFGR